MNELYRTITLHKEDGEMGVIRTITVANGVNGFAYQVQVMDVRTLYPGTNASTSEVQFPYCRPTDSSDEAFTIWETLRNQSVDDGFIPDSNWPGAAVTISALIP